MSAPLVKGQQSGESRRTRWRELLLDLLISAAFPMVFWVALVGWLAGALLDLPILRHAASVLFLLFAISMLAGFIYGIHKGVAFPFEFVRKYRTLSTAQKLIYTPLTLLLILMMLALIASAIALASHYARGIY